MSDIFENLDTFLHNFLLSVHPLLLVTHLQLAEILLVTPKCEIIFGTLSKYELLLMLPIKFLIFQLCNSKKRRAFLHFSIGYVDWFMASFLYCSLYNYRTTNYRCSYSWKTISSKKAINNWKQRTDIKNKAKKINFTGTNREYSSITIAIWDKVTQSFCI